MTTESSPEQVFQVSWTLHKTNPKENYASKHLVLGPLIVNYVKSIVHIFKLEIHCGNHLHNIVPPSNFQRLWPRGHFWLFTSWHTLILCLLIYRFQNMNKFTASSSAVLIYISLPFNHLNYILLHILHSYKSALLTRYIISVGFMHHTTGEIKLYPIMHFCWWPLCGTHRAQNSMWH